MTNTLLSCITFITLAAAAAGAATGGLGRIVGGTNARNGDFPEVVSVLEDFLLGQSEHLCGGVIINDNHVLTTATCVQDYGATGLQVMGAGTNLGGTAGYEEFKNVQRKFIHPEFNASSKANDLAVLRLSHNFVFVTGLITPADLPLTGTPEPALDTLMSVAGWGRDQYEGGLQLQMKAVNMTYLPYADCQVVFGPQLQDNNACLTGDIGKGVCEGDEGAGVFNTADRSLAALVAWHVGCDAYPAAVTLLAPYYDWIISMFEA
ncbi:hypothetical protein Pcinc_033680 [Petrolisthes cinctipes]|uniref:Peptidase S1 domain-containing protein n=1 Tax=Petrolisthes cinctipes TaxID=88211 RepID=A0AAE1ERY9_PETCI|nr:hypothetical protein Pcinc_033680 [Petrolisthes cinctipes]